MVDRKSAQPIALSISLLIAICLLLLPRATDDARALETESFVPDQIIVKLAPGVGIGGINLSYNTRTVECFISCKNSPDSRVYLLEIPDGANIQTKLDMLSSDTRVEYAELNYLVDAPEADDETQANAKHYAFPAGNATPTTKNYSQESSYSDAALHLTDARKISKGTGTTVAIIDTGAQMDHPALKSQFVGIPRYDFVSNDKDPSEPPLADTEEQRNREVVGHGTHVAGIVHLVAPQAALMPLRVLNRDGSGSVFHVAEAVAFADANDADVINLSLGTPSWSRLLREKVVGAINHGSVVAAAAGNYNNFLVPQYPASRDAPVAEPDDGLLAVTSVSPPRGETKSDFANYGRWVDIAAPGEDILSTYPVSRYAYWSGTSMATPFVAGEAALVRAADKLGPVGVEKRIRSGADCLDDTSGYPGLLGAGRADIGASLKGVEGQHCFLQAAP
jgi:thermitase